MTSLKLGPKSPSQATLEFCQWPGVILGKGYLGPTFAPFAGCAMNWCTVAKHTPSQGPQVRIQAELSKIGWLHVEEVRLEWLHCIQSNAACQTLALGMLPAKLRRFPPFWATWCLFRGVFLGRVVEAAKSFRGTGTAERPQCVLLGLSFVGFWHFQPEMAVLAPELRRFCRAPYQFVSMSATIVAPNFMFWKGACHCKRWLPQSLKFVTGLLAKRSKLACCWLAWLLLAC